MTTIRILAFTLAGIGALCVLTGCAPVAAGATTSSGDPADTLTVFISGDTNIQDLWEKGLIPAYEQAHPGVSVKTTIDLHGEHDQQTLAKLTSATAAGEDPGFDLIDAGFVTGGAADAGVLQPVGADTVSGLAGVAADTVAAGKGVGIPYRASSVLLAYDSTQVTSPPQTLADLLAWIPAHPGQFTYNSPSTGGSGGAFVTTVLDSFLSDADQKALRTSDASGPESGWDAGFAALKKLGPSMYQGGVYPNGNAQVLQLLGSGEISMAPVWSDQFVTAQKNGQIPDTVKFTQVSDPSFTGSASYLGIPRSSAHTAAAEDLANFVLSPAGQQIIAQQISGYPVVALDTLSQDVQDQFADADPSALRPGYISGVASDMSNQWDQRVP